VHLTKQNQLFKYLPFAYFLLTAYTVFLGVNNFWVQQDRKYYFYDHPFLTSKYFTLSVVAMGFIGIAI
jgi:hypothetical protein